MTKSTKEDALYAKILEIRNKAIDLADQYSRMRHLGYSAAHKKLYQEMEDFINKH